MKDNTTVKEALESIEKTCEWDRKCRQTAVTFLDGLPVCEYHSGLLMTGEDGGDE